MTRRIKPTILIAIAAAVLLFSAVYALPDSVKAVEMLVITNTPTPTPDTPTPTNTPTEPTVEPPTDTPTPTATNTPTSVTTTPDTPTPTKSARTPSPPKETEVVLLPETGEYPIDPQLGIQLFFAIAFFAVIGIVLFRAVRGSKAQE